MKRKRRDNAERAEGRSGRMEETDGVDVRMKSGVRGGKGRGDKKNKVMRAQGLKIVIGWRGGGRGGGGCGVAS